VAFLPKHFKEIFAHKEIKVAFKILRAQTCPNLHLLVDQFTRRAETRNIRPFWAPGQLPGFTINGNSQVKILIEPDDLSQQRNNAVKLIGQCSYFEQFIFP
jgi:hypothetical protein